MYYVVDVKKEGPYSIEELASKKMTGDVYVWKEGMATWGKMAELEEFKTTGIATPPPLIVKKEAAAHTYHESTEAAHKNSSATYFIFMDNKTEGPYNFEALLTRKLTGDTLVWKQGMTSWLKASELEELNTGKES